MNFNIHMTTHMGGFRWSAIVPAFGANGVVCPEPDKISWPTTFERNVERMLSSVGLVAVTVGYPTYTTDGYFHCRVVVGTGRVLEFLACATKAISLDEPFPIDLVAAVTP